MYEIKCETYSDNSVVLRGPDTIKFKDTLKEFGGKWNSNLKGGAGWIFSLSAKEKITKFLEIIKMTTEKPTSSVVDEDTSSPRIEDYTDKSFILVGGTRPFKDKIKELGGTWNSKLKDGKKAWVFPLTKKKDVQDWLGEIDEDDDEVEIEVEIEDKPRKRLIK